MPRIRTVKPEMAHHEQMATCTIQAQLLAVRLLNHSDDEGFFKANPKLIKANCFPLSDCDLEQIELMLKELENIGYINLLEGSDGNRYGKVTNFNKHQVINKSTPSQIRPLVDLRQDSNTTTGVLQEHSVLERNGMEKNGLLPDSTESGKTQNTYKTKKGRLLQGEQLKMFKKFWNAFNHKEARAKAADAWLDLKVDNELFGQILFGAQEEAKNRRKLVDSGLTPKYPQGWLSDRRWEKWVELEADRKRAQEKASESVTSPENTSPQEPDWEIVGKQYDMLWDPKREIFSHFVNRVRAIYVARQQSFN